MTPSLPELAARIAAAPRKGRRRLVALAGAPGSGKSTLAEGLASALLSAGTKAAVVPMDGFHLNNPVLIERDLLARKGAPETFDVSGFRHLMARLAAEEDVFYPVFDRARDIAIAAGGYVHAGCDTVIVEGNYLLYDAPGWRELAAGWDLSIRLDVPFETLRARLIARWRDHGLSLAEAEARAGENDLVNARAIVDAALEADVVVAG